MYGLADICEVLCYNSRFEDYKGLYGIATDLLQKKERNKANFFSLLSMLYSFSFLHIFVPYFCRSRRFAVPRVSTAEEKDKAEHRQARCTTARSNEKGM